MITLSRTMRGAPVMEYGLEGSVVCTDQASLPLVASTAISRPSIVASYTRPFQSAGPRFDGPQHM